MSEDIQYGSAILPDDIQDTIALFRDCFGNSEGPEEGESIAVLVQTLLHTPDSSPVCHLARLQDRRIVGAIIWTPLVYAGTSPNVMLLSPVAVATEFQGRGIGQGLIAHGVRQMRAAGVDGLVTYGDPAFYGKSGFVQASTSEIAPPSPLTYPDGWLVRWLTPGAMPNLTTAPQAVPAFDDPAYW